MRAKSKALASVVAAALALGGATTAYAASQAPTAEVSATVPVSGKVGAADDGRSLFRGILFGQGEVAEKLGESEELFATMGEGYEKNNSSDVLKAGDAVMDAVEKNRPGAMAEFSTEMRSGDVERVQTALQKTTDDLVDVGVIAEEKDDASGTCLYVAVGAALVHVAGGLTAAVVAVMEAAVVGANWVYGTNWVISSASDSSLSKEQAVAEFSKLLKA
ncbi:hypothetical protein [Streptomyces sulphureus]|uniref:hypothetical protein n=1 Tax=Streptomyces sulphureus TaxID=47758 RepID=UPI00035F7F89|nr:hypothetical protein [Streptomyces sulphureus]